MELIHYYFHEEINTYDLKVNLLTNVEINVIFVGNNEFLISRIYLFKVLRNI